MGGNLGEMELATGIKQHVPFRVCYTKIRGPCVAIVEVKGTSRKANCLV